MADMSGMQDPENGLYGPMNPGAWEDESGHIYGGIALYEALMWFFVSSHALAA
jgi:hypothetical protein